jgi:hypothetical protein
MQRSARLTGGRFRLRRNAKSDEGCSGAETSGDTDVASLIRASTKAKSRQVSLPAFL